MDEFQEIVERSEVKRRWEIGEKYEVKIVGRSKEHAYVDCGDKKEGLIRIEEFIDQKGEVSLKEGETVEAYYIGTSGGFRIFTTLMHGYSTLDLKRIRDAYEEGKPIEGKVIAQKKGGFEVEIGKIRCFCPYSQIGERDELAGDFLGRTMSFKVLAFEDEGKNVVLSRRALLEEERKERIERLKEQIKEGSVITGKIKRIGTGGATIDLGGVQAYLPKSEISWTYVEEVKDFFSVGESIEAKVKEIDWENKKIVLSLKELSEDPYALFSKKYGRGSIIEGTISKVEPFGVFVSLVEGVEGFAHVSKLGKKGMVKDLSKFFKEGERLRVRILEIDLAKRKVFLQVEEETTGDIEYPEFGEKLECKVVKVLQKGLLVETPSGVLGYVPEGELNVRGEKAKSNHYKEGKNLRAIVLQVDREKGKILLSEKKVEEFEEKEAYRAYKEKVEKETSSFGRLKDLLEEKLK